MVFYRKDGEEVIPLREFLNTGDEFHTAVIGYCEVMCPYPPVIACSEAVKEVAGKEYHYYAFGRAMGLISWVAIIIASIKLLGG